MSILVMKFGGTSVANLDRIQRAARASNLAISPASAVPPLTEEAVPPTLSLMLMPGI